MLKVRPLIFKKDYQARIYPGVFILSRTNSVRIVIADKLLMENGLFGKLSTAQ